MPHNKETVPMSEMCALYRAYVILLETGRDRIRDLGGDCDAVDVMEDGDPALRRARAIMATTKEETSDTGEIETVKAELAIRKRQIGLMANCLSHIQNSPIAPEPIRIAATAAIVGASELMKEISDGQ